MAITGVMIEYQQQGGTWSTPSQKELTTTTDINNFFSTNKYLLQDVAFTAGQIWEIRTSCRADNTIVYGSTNAPWSTVQTVTIQANQAPTVSSLATQNVTTTSMNIQGVISDTESDTITGVKIEMRAAGAADWLTLINSIELLDTSVGGNIALFMGAEDWYTWTFGTALTAGNNYDYRVTAKDSVNISYGSWTESLYSGGGGISIVVNQAPSIPSNPASSNITSSGFTLSWSASTDPEGNTPITYNVYKNDVLQAGFSGGTTNSVAITGQTSGTSATWKMSAVDSFGLESDKSTGLQVIIPLADFVANEQYLGSQDPVGFFDFRRLVSTGTVTHNNDAAGTPYMRLAQTSSTEDVYFYHTVSNPANITNGKTTEIKMRRTTGAPAYVQFISTQADNDGYNRYILDNGNPSNWEVYRLLEYANNTHELYRDNVLLLSGNTAQMAATGIQNRLIVGKTNNNTTAWHLDVAYIKIASGIHK